MTTQQDHTEQHGSNLLAGSSGGETLYLSDHVRVSRRVLPDGGGAVIVKQVTGNQAIRRLNHEATILARLANVAGVVKIASGLNEANTLVLTDDGCMALSEYLKAERLSLVQAVELTLAVVRILAGVHKAGVIHNDICPSNILVHPETRQPILIDFNIASCMAEPGTDTASEAGIAGTLSYMSPEQTGRTGRATDQRSDLYSLGITLYELVTHRKPFESDDLLELVHDHLVRVPDTPTQLNPEVPQVLSDLIMRLLEKEPDRRYQSADGLAQDLQRLGAMLRSGDLIPFPLGQSDFGARLNPPTHLIGRDAEITALRAAVSRITEGRSPCLLLSGPPGVGKSALLDQLRPMVASQRAWFIVSRFEQSRQDSPRSASEAFQTLGRQLLAQPEDQLALYRERILTGLGSNLGIGPTLLPEFELLLGKHPAIQLTDPREAEARTVQAALDILRCVATPERPLVLVYDDMQWAHSLAMKLLDALVASVEPIPGLLVVCTYDASELGELGVAHPLKAMLERWKALNPAPPELPVGNLTLAAASELIGAMLRLPGHEADKLAEVIGERTQNNPLHTIEFLNALRQDGLLVLENGRWVWDAASLRRYVGNLSPAELRRRIDKLQAETAELLQNLACLGREARQDALLLATGLNANVLHQRLNLSVDDGLLISIPGDPPAVRFTNERVHRAALDSIPAEQRSSMHLSLARHLTEHAAEHTTDRAELEVLAAEQYLAAVPAISAETERRHAVGLFERAAQRLRLSSPVEAERYLAAAIGLIRAVETPADAQRLFALEIEYHRALFEQGRLEEADALYDALVSHAADPVDLLEPMRIQTYSLSNRQRYVESMNLGLNLLAKLGLEKPADVRPDLGAGIQRVTLWLNSDDKLKDFERPEITDPRVVAWSKVIPETSVPAYFVDLTAWAWLVITTHRLWMEHGPSPRLLSGTGAVPLLLVGTPQNYRGAYDFARHFMAVGEARGYELGASFTRCIFGIAAAHWVEPLETVLESFHRARTDLKRMGDESFISFTYMVSDVLFDCGATLDAADAEVDAGLAFAARSDNQEYLQRYRPRKQLILALRGKTRAPGSFTDASFDEASYAGGIDPTSPTAATYHMVRSIAAAIFGDIPTLGAHAAPAIPLSARTPGYYLTAIARVLQALALAEKARSLPAAERAPVLEELDNTCLKWLALRAADAPENFMHLLRWVEAERAWAADSVWVAGAAFDTAVQEAALHSRPWHRALINERAALFQMNQGMEHSARPLLMQACEIYEAWGAEGKVRELRRTHAFLRAGSRQRAEGGERSTVVVDTEMVDMMAVLRASQALSSETSLTRLTQQVGKVLGTITGATGVQLIIKPDDSHANWVMASSLADGATPISVEQAGANGDIPLSMFRYVERTNELLVIEDARRDDRFATDPYVERFDQCSLLLAPILKHGQLHAMLVLENHQRRGAFSGERLDSVSMIAGQLSVSLDNALLYASLEKRVAERTAQLRQKTQDINAMLQNMPQGVLTVVSGNLIHPEYSAYLESIFETREIAGRSLMELAFTQTSLSSDILSQLEATFGACIGEDEMNFEFNSHLLATEFDKKMPDGRIKSLELSWSPICDEQNVVEKLMICVRDVTEFKRLASEASAQKRELEIIGEILAVSQEKFQEFIHSASQFVDENDEIIRRTRQRDSEIVTQLFRNMHTIKGNARTYGLLHMTSIVHETEMVYDELRKNPDRAWAPEGLLEQLAQVRELLAEYAKINDTTLGRKGPGRRGSVERFLIVDKEQVAHSLALIHSTNQSDLAALRATLDHIANTLNLIGTEQIGNVLAGVIESLPSLARELGKEPPEVTIQNNGVVVRSQIGGLLKNLFVHLFRNSMDHGLETGDVRQAAGKDAVGHIQLSLALEDDQFRLRLRDDGRGLAIAKIRARAIEKGLLDDGEAASAERVAQMIFEPGFSTAEKVTEVSGRGVGMDAVLGFLRKEEGDAYLHLLDANDAADFRPFEIVISLPGKFAVMTNVADLGGSRV